MFSKRFMGIWLTLAMTTFFSTAVKAEELSWTGCGISKKAFMTEMAKAYEAKTGVGIKLSGGGATKGIRAAAAGTSDLGGACRHWLKGVNGDVHPEETDAELVQVAWDALVVIAHPENSVESITLDQLKGVYSGEISSWSALGGEDKRIGLVVRDGKTSGVGYMLRQLVFGDADYEFGARSLKVKSTGPLEKKVESLKTAFAVDGISSAKRRKVKFLSIDGVQPTKENIANGSYTLYRPLYIAVNKQSRSKAADKFIEFVLSDEGQALISEQGTVNLKEGSALTAKWESKKKSIGL